MIAMIGIVMLAIWVHVALLGIVTIDVVNDYIPWFNHIVDRGIIPAFAHPFGSYSPPYLYLLAALTPLKGILSDAMIIKTGSMLSNAALAAAIWHLLRRQGIADRRLLAVAAMMLPSLVLNAALLSQCDALYVAPIVMALSAVLQRQHRAMLAWMGLALAIKLQAVLFGPFILAMLIARRVPVRDWLIAPVAFALAMLPAWAAGWPASDLVLIYFRQARDFDAAYLNAPNIWTVLQVFGVPIATLFALAMASAIGSSAAYLAQIGATARYFTDQQIVRAALLAPLMTAGLLPRMHERYFLAADIVAFLLFAIDRQWRSARLVLLTQAGSCAAIFAYISGAPIFAALGAVPMIFAGLIVCQQLFQTAANDNPLMARPA
jgi:Gpi18-like mannosyltransferase